MTSSQHLIEAFKREWAAGARPAVDSVLAAISDPHEREGTRRQLEEYLSEAPTPAYPAVTLAALRSDEAVARATAAFEDDEELGPLVRRLRWGREVRLDQLTDTLIDRLELPDKPAKVKRYLHELENGLLDPRGLSQALISALASILGTTSERLRIATASWTQPAPRLASQYQRSYEEQPPFSVVPPDYESARDVRDGRDAIDELFLGG